MINKNDELALRIANQISQVEDPSLFSGKSGMILALAYYYKYENSSHTKKLKEQIYSGVESILDDLENLHLDSSLSNGLAGIAYTLKICKDLDILKEIDEEWYTPIDTIICNSLENLLNIKEYDLLRGASGLIVYLQTNEKYKLYIERYIDSLFENAIWESKDTCYWIFYSYNEQRKQLEYNSEIINLGLAHGLPCIISILSDLYKKGYKKDKCKILINGAINYLKNVRQKDNLSQFTNIFKKNEIEQTPSRLGWCYGDTGVGLSIIKAGIYLDKNVWLNYGTEICLGSLERNFRNSGLHEHGICHGYLGACHIYNRLYYATNKREFLERKNYWYKIAIENKDFKIDPSGYYQTELNNELNFDKYTTFGLLQGLSGVLLYESTHNFIKHSWDNVFLTNISI